MEGKSIAGLTDYAFEMLGYDKEISGSRKLHS